MISEQKAAVSHGVLLIALFSFSAFYISEFQWVKDLSLSPLIVGIILGTVSYTHLTLPTNPRV